MNLSKVKPLIARRAPRFFEHWERRLGLNRVEIQAAHSSGVILGVCQAKLGRVLPARVSLSVAKMRAGIEGRIDLLQIDPSDMREDMRNAKAVLARYGQIFDRAPIGFHRINTQGIIRGINQRWLELMGYEESEVVGKHFSDFLVPEQKANAMERFSARIKDRALPPKQGDSKGDRQYLSKDGRRVSIITYDTVLRDGEGRPVGVLTSFQDVTELRSLEERLIIKERQAAVGEMAAQLSHEYRNQITCIEGFADALTDVIEQQRAFEAVLAARQRAGMAMGEKERQLLFALHRGVDQSIAGFQDELGRMEETAADVLRLSRIGTTGEVSAGRESGALSIIQVNKQIAEVCLTLQSQKADPAGVTVEVQLERLRDTDGVLMVEREFRDVIANLVRNAIEAFSDEGQEGRQVVVRARIIRRRMIRIEVQDNGDGIEPDLLEQVFRGKVETTKGIGGTGIGLKAVGEAVDRAGGGKTIESRIGMGTTVTIDLPLQRYVVGSQSVQGPESVCEIDREEAFRVNVWVVDDEKTIRVNIARLLRGRGFQVREMGSGEEAMAEYESADQRPQVIITDLRMQGLSGEELIQSIIDRGGDLPHFAICSGNPLPSDPSDPLVKLVQRQGALFLQKPEGVRHIDSAVVAMVGQEGDEKGDVPSSRRGPLAELEANPYSLLVIRAAHEVNNLGATVAMAIETCEVHAASGADIPERAIQRLRDTYERFNELINSFISFAESANSLSTVRSLEDTVLPAKLVRDPDLGSRWAFHADDEKYKFALMIDLYLRSGLLELRDELAGILSTETITAVQLRQVSALDIEQRIGRLRTAVFLEGDAENNLADRFRRYYKLLNDL